jgi:hypothetical protein
LISQASAVIYFATFLIPPMATNGQAADLQVNAQIAAYGGIWALLIRGMLATQYDIDRLTIVTFLFFFIYIVMLQWTIVVLLWFFFFFGSFFFLR